MFDWSGKKRRERLRLLEQWRAETRESWQAIADKYQLDIVIEESDSIGLHAKIPVQNDLTETIALGLEGDALFIWIGGCTYELFPYEKKLKYHFEMLEHLLDGTGRVLRIPPVRRPKFLLRTQMQVGAGDDWETRCSCSSVKWTEAGEREVVFQRRLNNP